MVYEVFKLNELSRECNYESYALTLTVGDLIQTSHSSNIQRVRNEEKEKGIMKFIKGHIDKNQTPFFQPFILHYNGDIIKDNGTYILNPKNQFEVEIEIEDGKTATKSFIFEVLDGNGRLNALIKLQQSYINKMHSLSNELKAEGTTDKRKKRIQKQLDDLKVKNSTLTGTKLAVQLYLNLDEKQKASLFNSVNQGETMSKGRLEIYSNKKAENELLYEYILHTSNLDGFKYKVSVDKDIVRSSKEREEFIPSIYLLPTLKKLIKYYKGQDLNEYKEVAFNAIDKYIMNVPNPRLLRKQFFSILGSVIETSSDYEGELSEFTSKMANFDFKQYPDVSKEQKLVRTKVLEFVFENATKKETSNNEEGLQGMIDIDKLENDNLALQEVAMTDQ